MAGAFGIDKGITKAFILMILIVGALTTFFLSEYVAGILLGSVFYVANNGTTYTSATITGESIIANNTVPQLLANSPVVTGTLTLENETQQWDLSNFTIHYNNGSIFLIDTVTISDGTVLSANYTYVTETASALQITADSQTLLDNMEDDFVTTFGYVNTGLKFAAALITIAAVILIFSSFLPKKGGKEQVDY